METWLDAYAARAFDDRPAVVEPGRVLTSRELTALAASANRWLDTIGAPAGRPLAALVSTTTEAFALTIAGAASGRPIAPLGTRLTATEVMRSLATLEPGALIAEPDAHQLAIEAAGDSGLAVHRHPVFEPGSAAIELTAPIEAAAAVLHTSGTSGEPKPVPYPQHRLLLRTRVNSAILGLGDGCVYATASPFHHIAGLGMLFVALGAGAALCPLSRFTADSWDEVIGRGTTHALLVPSMIDRLLDDRRLARGQLRCLQYGASRIDPGTLRRLLDALPGLDLVQIYGQTEGSPITALTTDDHRAAAAGEERLLASAGTAAPGVSLRIAHPDETGVGEVWARADHLMKPDPDGWLRTGDLGRIDEGGYLTLVGRKGDMIIRGGENVYPVEVEDVLRRHAAVADVAVVGAPDQRLGQVVVAHIVARDPADPPDVADLRAHARAVLAGFKVPERWEFTRELPRNAAGKVLKRSLIPPSPPPASQGEHPRP
ncbi:MAG TPA: class I adenylate-forming enzyme family protein [Ilumatobacter sp.]